MSGTVAVSAWDAHYAAGRGFRPLMSEEQQLFEHQVGTADTAGLLALDIGCGTGEFARYLSACGYDALGVDCAPTAISLASTRYDNIDNLSFRHWNAESEEWDTLPRYAVITARLSYAFIQNKTQFLEQIRKHLVPGGYFHVMTPRAEHLPPERRNTGITAAEITELRAGWARVREHDLDAQHTCYTLTHQHES
ncbi:class I SAM-dependent methyltransferase [Streptomyces sp. NPDC056682]|uniref:class I SAM-dependent methyltransferase n=1 Tax=Streptomyces sp. NPDC056682 TaxID=3345909 RepID=UPI0036BA8C66